MTWTDPSTFLNDIDNPVRSADAKADAANIEALANGDAGAPPIQEVALSTTVQTKLNDGANAARLNTPIAGATKQQKVMGSDSLSGVSSGGPEAVTTVNLGIDALATAVTNGNVTFESAVALSLSVPTDNVQVTRKVYVNNTAVVTHNYSVDGTSTTEADTIAVIQGDLIYSTITVTVTTGTITSFTSTNNIKTGNDVLGVL